MVEEAGVEVFAVLVVFVLVGRAVWRTVTADMT